MLIQGAEQGDYEYTCGQPADWTPYNSNLQMGAIKVGGGKLGGSNGHLCQLSVKAQK